MKDRISTQAMGANVSTSAFSFPATAPENAGPMPVVKRTSFTEQEREELKEIFHSVLEEYGLVRRINN
tara:strand:- start:299 stop:502 length:204 start_codon:yes stop_codon:yes gene_type:complete